MRGAFYKLIFLFVIIFSWNIAYCFDFNTKLEIYSYTPADSVEVIRLLDQSQVISGSDYREALNLSYQALEIARQIQDPPLIQMAELSISKLFFYLGIYDRALESSMNALNIARNEDDFLGLAKGYFQLASIRLVMEDYLDAQKHLNASKSFYLKYYNEESNIDSLTRITMHNNLGLILSGVKEFVQAEKEYLNGISLLSDASEFNDTAVKLYNNLGELYQRMKRNKESIEYYLLAKEQLLKKPNLLLDAMLSNSLGKAYIGLGNYQEAVEIFHRGLAHARSVQGYSHLHHISKGLSRAHEFLGNQDSAFIYLSLSRVYEDSLNIKNTAEKIAREELLTDFIQEKSELVRLYEINKRYLYYSLGVLLIGLCMLYIRSRLIKRRLHIIDNDKRMLEVVAEQSIEAAEKLKEKIEHTQKELTLASMQAIQKDEMLKILSKSLTSKNSTSQIIDQNKIAKILDGLTSDQSESALSEFELRFSNIYVGFFEKLLNEYPALSQNERRLCAFLKLSMTTKEIAAITGQSIRAIEIARTRLRKKIKLTNSETNLYDFFVNY